MAFVPVPPPPDVLTRDPDSFCGGIPPLVTWSDGSTCINPDFDHVWKFHLAAKATDPAFPERGLVPNPTIPVDGELHFQLTVPQEENGMGALCINELLMVVTFGGVPVNASSLKIDIKSLQDDKTFTNASVFNWTVFGNSQLNCCLPEPIRLLPNQTIVFSVTNFEGVPVSVRIVARGQRFMPYHDMPLRDEMARSWLRSQSIPMWLGLDELQVEVPASGTAQGQITIPGGGYFELFHIRGKVQPIGTPTAEDLLVNVTEGRIGRRLMNEPIPLSLYMTEDKIVAGMTDGVFRAAQACHCPGPRQIFRENMRVIHDFQNLSAAGAAFVELTFVGVYHFVSACPPNADLERVRREAWAGCGVYADEEDYPCPLPAVPLPPFEEEHPELPALPYEDYAEGYGEALAPPPPSPPEPLRIVSMWRPSKAYYGPGSAPAIPWQYNYGKDQHGKAHLVVRNPQTNAFVRFATAQEQRPFQYTIDMYNEKAGLSGLGRSGPQGDWERI